MEKTWRWFGPNDPITLDMLRQIGVEGIVTALHDVPNGDVWEIENISRRKAYIESHGLRWSVVESLPVCEAVKYGGAERDRLIENYKNSLANLGRCGIKTVCYNFMPVIDWIRTDLQHPWADGTTSLYFDRARFAYFDLHILERPGAEKDYPDPLLAKVEEMGKVISEKEKNDLIETIIVKTQGFVNGNIKEGDENPVKIFKKLLSHYEGIDRAALRENMRYFLSAIMPVCETFGINMCVHPAFPSPGSSPHRNRRSRHRMDTPCRRQPAQRTHFLRRVAQCRVTKRHTGTGPEICQTNTLRAPAEYRNFPRRKFHRELPPIGARTSHRLDTCF